MKKILCLTIALGLAGFVVGCGGEPEKKTETKKVETTSPGGEVKKTEETKETKH